MPAADPILRPAAEISALRTRVAELETERDTATAQAWRDGADDATVTWQRDINEWRQKVEALEASRARLAAFVRAEDAYAIALSRSWEGQISRTRGEKALARAALTAQDLAPETPRG